MVDQPSYNTKDGKDEENVKLNSENADAIMNLINTSKA